VSSSHWSILVICYRQSFVFAEQQMINECIVCVFRHQLQAQSSVQHLTTTATTTTLPTHNQMTASGKLLLHRMSAHWLYAVWLWSANTSSCQWNEWRWKHSWNEKNYTTLAPKYSKCRLCLCWDMLFFISRPSKKYRAQNTRQIELYALQWLVQLMLTD